MSTTKSEKLFAKRISVLAGIEAKKLGLSPKQFNGAFVADSFIFEVQFENTLRNTPCAGNA